MLSTDSDSAVDVVVRHLNAQLDDRSSLESRASFTLSTLAARLLGARGAVTLFADGTAFLTVDYLDDEPWASLCSDPRFLALARENQLETFSRVTDCRTADGVLAKAMSDFGVGSFIGAPMRTASGERLGTFLALDSSPHEWYEDDLDALGDIVELVITKFDLRLANERVREQAALAGLSDRRLRQIVETAHEAFVAMNAEGVVEDWNTAAQMMFGYQRDEAVGRSVAELIVPDRLRDGHGSGVEQFLKGGEPQMIGRTAELTAMRADGSEFPVELSISSLDTREGCFFNAFIRDITERRKVERLKDEFLAMVSHELRTPLASIVAHVELLLEDELPQDMRERFADVIDRNTTRLQRLVGDLLFGAALDHSELKLSMGPVNLAQIARDAVDAARPNAIGVALSVDANDDLPEIHGDGDRLAQAIDNLISNAIKYSPDGGDVSVRVTAGEEILLVEVSDQGLGISAEDQARLFDRFFRTDSATERHIQGVGLGLLIVKTIVEAHGGRVTVASEPGTGSTFAIELPLSNHPH